MTYLDYAATCPVVKYPQQLYHNVLGEGYFLNPNANYAYKEKRLLSEAENRVKKAIGAKGGKVIFGGTSSQLIENLMTAVDEQTNYRHVICSAFEHDSFLRHGDVIEYSDKDLLDKLQTAKEYVTEAQKFAMWQGVNNLTGEIMPVVDIGNACHKYDNFYICDMTAMIGHAPIPVNIDDWCDCAVWSGHKLGTELGIGCMWISDRLDKWLDGFVLYGTPNLAGACAMADAVEDACDISILEEKQANWMDLSDELYSRLLDVCDNVKKVGNNEGCWAISSIRLPGIQAEALQQYLASKDIYIGVGHSSCSNDTRVLEAYGLSKEEVHEVIRVSFSEDSSVEDVKALVEGIVAFRKEYL